MSDHNKNLEELKLLDLRKCETVSDIVDGMKYCSFGARMLGEVTSTIYDMVSKGKKPIIIYDGKLDTSLGKLIWNMYGKKWVENVSAPEDYVREKPRNPNVIVVGHYSERHEDILYTRPERSIFINSFGLAKPGQVKDGYFPDVIFADPRYIIPIINFTLEERLEDKKKTSTDLIRELENYGGIASQVNHGAETLRLMIEDKKCTKFLTLSGAMTIAKMGLIICDMIDNEMVNYIASTGALMAHGLVEGVGLKHYKYNPKDNDAELAALELNRVTDTLEPETNLDAVEKVIDEILDNVGDKKHISPAILHYMIGEYLSKNHPNERGILKSAYEKKVPVLVPAFADSEIGNDIYVHNRKREGSGKSELIMNMEVDTKKLVEMATNSERMGIFTIGGGVPRNFTQNVSPLIEIANRRLGTTLKEIKFSYGTRICPDESYFGHLSGCTYSEGMSWRKMDPNGRFSEIRADATQVWPFLVKYLMER